LHQIRCLDIDIQANDVDGMVIPASGDFDAGDQHDIAPACRLGRFRQTTGIVMVGQGEQPDAPGYRTEDEFGWRQHSIGMDGVGVQINAQ